MIRLVPAHPATVITTILADEAILARMLFSLFSFGFRDIHFAL